MSLQEFIKATIGNTNMNSYYAIDNYGEKVVIRANQMPVEDKKYKVISTSESYINKLLNAE